MKKIIILALCVCTNLFAQIPEKVSNQTIQGLWITGYQAWFRTPNDGGQSPSWHHYFHGAPKVENWTMDYWADVSEYPEDSLTIIPDMYFEDGTPVYAYASIHPKVIDTHFKWMKEYDIDGVWLQYFTISNNAQNRENKNREEIIKMVAQAAAKYGRLWSISYDPASHDAATVYDDIISHWKHLVDSGLTAQDCYMNEQGLPVVQIWSFSGIQNPWIPINAEIGNKLINFFNQEGKYKAFLVAGVNWDWGSIKDQEYQDMYAKLKAVIPWNVGNIARNEKQEAMSSMSFWRSDFERTEGRGTIWIPTVYPGFSWENLQRVRNNPESAANIAGRRKGEYLWEQLYKCSEIGATSLCLSMFDEVDEGTAFFKIETRDMSHLNLKNSDGMPADWWLRLVREAHKYQREGKPLPKEIPIKP